MKKYELDTSKKSSSETTNTSTSSIASEPLRTLLTLEQETMAVMSPQKITLVNTVTVGFTIPPLS